MTDQSQKWYETARWKALPYALAVAYLFLGIKYGAQFLEQKAIGGAIILSLAAGGMTLLRMLFGIIVFWGLNTAHWMVISVIDNEHCNLPLWEDIDEQGERVTPLSDGRELFVFGGTPRQKVACQIIGMITAAAVGVLLFWLL